jgi:hypothetical protein
MVTALVGDASQVFARQDTGRARQGHTARGEDPQRLVQGCRRQATVRQFKRLGRKPTPAASHGFTGREWS